MDATRIDRIMRIIGFLLLVSLGILVNPVGAHKARTARKVMATISPELGGLRIDVILWQHIAGVRSKRILAQFDLDGSKSFNKTEALLAGNHLSTETIGTFFIVADGQALKPKTAQSKAARLDAQTVESMVLLSYYLPKTLSASVVFKLHRAAKLHARALEVTAKMPLLLTSKTGPESVQRGLKLTPRKPVGIRVAVDPLMWLRRMGLYPF
ncbi:MAG: hypothetical protein CMH52_13490 [Myxococcales bacterium]|nr:hypothetical protein [Myxococcales bacterium]